MGTIKATYTVTIISIGDNERNTANFCKQALSSIIGCNDVKMEIKRIPNKYVEIEIKGRK